MLDRVAALPQWRPCSAWESAGAIAGRSGNQDGNAGVILRLRDHIDMATIIVRPGGGDAFRDFVALRWGFDLPASGRCAGPRSGELIWSAPNQWLSVGGPASDVDALATDLAGIASVSAQGDGRALVDVDGPCARTMLAKLVAVDLDPAVFAPGSVAVTALAHGSVQLWQRRGAGALTLSVPRTLAGSVHAMLMSAAAEFGCDTILPG